VAKGKEQKKQRNKVMVRQMKVQTGGKSELEKGIRNAKENLGEKKVGG
jgi:hypothetical protein